MLEQTINNFSLISRLFGNLFYRAPTDPVLTNVFTWLEQKGLSQVWALELNKESESALNNLQLPIDKHALQTEYDFLFTSENAVSRAISSYEINAEDFRTFRQLRAMPEVESADNFALVLLTASWIEDNLPQSQAQRDLFEQFLLPCASRFLTQVENRAKLPFYRSLALLTREILAAMADELDESETL